MGEAIKKWQMATIEDHTNTDVLIALSRAYATEYVAHGYSSAAARKRTCFNGWKASSQALELMSPKFVEQVNDGSNAWREALSLVVGSGAEALYWYAHYDHCLYPKSGRLEPALARLRADEMGFECPPQSDGPIASSDWRATLPSVTTASGFGAKAGTVMSPKMTTSITAGYGPPLEAITTT